MKQFNTLSVRTIVSFFASLAVCSLVTGGIVLFGPFSNAWYNYPVIIALITACLLICLLFSMFVQSNFRLKQLQERFDNMVNTDALTGVYNRRYVDENIDHLIESVSRVKGTLTLMAIDVDYFKSYNDIYGYEKGDICLKIIANILSRSIKKDNDFVARYTGKEFLVVFPNTDENKAQMIAQRLLKNIRDCNMLHEKSEVANCVTISIGVTTGSVNDNHRRDNYISKAKEALYSSVQNGCNRYTFLSL